VLSPEQPSVDGTITVAYGGTAPVVDTAVIFPIARATQPWVVFTIAPEDPAVGPPEQFLRPQLAGAHIRFLASPLRHTGNRLPQWLTLTDDSGQTVKIVGTGVAEMPLADNTCSLDLCSQTIALKADLEAPALRDAITEWQSDWAVRADVRKSAELDSPSVNPDEIAFRVDAD